MKPKVKITITEAKQLQSIMEELSVMQKRSIFERFYDSITNLISNRKSFAPNELKTFR